MKFVQLRKYIAIYRGRRFHEFRGLEAISCCRMDDRDSTDAVVVERDDVSITGTFRQYFAACCYRRD